jgi:hypothetical protein
VVKTFLIYFVLFGLEIPLVCAPAKEVVLWAWDRAEDLRFLRPGEAQVAALVATIELGEGGVRTRWRAHPMRIADGIELMPVVRIEAPAKAVLPPVATIVQVLKRAAARGDSHWIQIDFDARGPQWGWYRELLREAKRELGVRISVTALLGSCFADGPIDARHDAIDEAVPMLFRMGPEAPEWLRRVEDPHRGLVSGCRTAVGLATDEPAAWRHAVGRSGRTFVFHPKAWTKEAFREVCARLFSPR